MSGASPVFAVLGQPVAHSLSPRIHNAALGALGIEATYVALPVEAPEVGSVMRTLVRGGGGGNVTLPHKGRAAEIVTPTAAVEATGACNTFWGEGEKILGDNTDVEGFLRSWLDLIGDAPKDATVAVLGAGGAARAVLHGLLEEGVGRVLLWNRTPEKAQDLIEHFDNARLKLMTGAETLRLPLVDVVVNTTSLGLKPTDALPVDLTAGEAPGAVLDLVYGTPSTPLVEMARSLGIPASDGKSMLVYQAGAAFQRWFGVEPPLEVMRAALSTPSA